MHVDTSTSDSMRVCALLVDVMSYPSLCLVNMLQCKAEVRMRHVDNVGGDPVMLLAKYSGWTYPEFRDHSSYPQSEMCVHCKGDGGCNGGRSTDWSLTTTQPRCPTLTPATATGSDSEGGCLRLTVHEAEHSRQHRLQQVSCLPPIQEQVKVWSERSAFARVLNITGLNRV